MATLKELKEMALHVARGTAPANFSTEDVKTAYKGEIEQLCGSINKFMKNKHDIYEIIIEVADEIVPQKAIESLGQFAEIKTVGQGQRAMFKRGRLGRARAKQFITRVGLSGVYETFRLDTDNFEVRAHGIGGGARIDFERFLDGAENINELMDIVLEGLEEAIFVEVQKALQSAIKSTYMPARNKYAGNSFDAKAMQRIIGTVKAYGAGAAIFATPEFVEEMGPDAIAVWNQNYQMSGTNPGYIVHPQDLDDIRNTGRIKIFRGTPIIELPQFFTDENNDTFFLNPAYAYILPTGGEKVVKVVFEGATQMWDWTNKDQSMEIMIYKKVGVGILAFNNWGVYHNYALDTTAPYTVDQANPTVLDVATGQDHYDGTAGLGIGIGE